PLFSGWIAQPPSPHWLPVIGRLKQGVSLAQAQADMDSVSSNLAKEFPAEDTGWTIRLTPLQQELVGDVRSALLVLLGAVGLVLLIGCANIAKLLLAQPSRRTRPTAPNSTRSADRTSIAHRECRAWFVRRHRRNP